MVAQQTGAATVVVVLLCYVLIVQAMMAAVVLLTEFIVLRVREVRRLVAVQVEPSPPMGTEQESQAQVIIGGSIRRWE